MNPIIAVPHCSCDVVRLKYEKNVKIVPFSPFIISFALTTFPFEFPFQTSSKQIMAVLAVSVPACLIYVYIGSGACGRGRLTRCGSPEFKTVQTHYWVTCVELDTMYIIALETLLIHIRFNFKDFGTVEFSTKSLLFKSR